MGAKSRKVSASLAGATATSYVALRCPARQPQSSVANARTLEVGVALTLVVDVLLLVARALRRHPGATLVQLE